MNWKRWTCAASLCLAALSTQAATPMIALGLDHALALRSDGTVVAWGSDQFGKLGTGRSLNATTPAVVPGLTGVKAIAGGRYNSFAIRQDGTLWAWGSNTEGQLGDGSKLDRTSPVQVPGIENVVMVCGGANFSTALRQDGTLWSWGDNFNGFLGTGNQNASSVPVQVAGLTSVTSVACGYGHALALLQDGTVWAWGSNDSGELGLGIPVVGDPSATRRLQPVQVPGLDDVVAIGAGFWFSTILKKDGTVWEWGRAVPDGSFRLSPVQSLGVAGALKLNTGTGRNAAINADGLTWWLWDSGAIPVMQYSVGSLEGVVPGNHTLLLKSDRTVMAFGHNANGQLGDGTTMSRSNPVPVSGLGNIVAVAHGYSHSLALDANGNVWTWGSDASGQLGRGGVLGSTIPIETIGLANIVQVSANGDKSLAVDQDGSVWVWGDNADIQLPDGTTSSGSTPVRLTSITDVQAASVGSAHTVALKRDGTVWAWGANWAGQLGNGSYSGSSVPIQVPGLADVVQVSAAPDHNLALTQDGTVWAWGQNNHGQLGLGTVDPFFINSTGSQPPNGRPAQVPGLTDVKAVMAAYSQSYALKKDGTVMAWGLGELGEGGDTERHSPGLVIGLSGVVEIAAGTTHSVARKADGSVWGWGRNIPGELGPNQSVIGTVPLSGLDAIEQIAAGQDFSALLRQDGLVYAGGSNRAGQLGEGTFAHHQSYVLVVNPGANGFLNLKPGTAFEVPPSVGVPFFVVSSGGISDDSATVYTRAKFNGADVGKSGKVFVTATVPPGSLVAAETPMSAAGSSSTSTGAASKLASSAVTGSSSFVLVNLTDTGWKPVTGGQLIPYASGVLGDQLSAQTILDKTDTSNLKGAQFCLGYGTSAEQMVATGTMRVVASIPDPNATGATTATCLVAGPPVSYGLALTQGWSLLGNSLNQSLSVASLYGDVNAITSVWKWDANTFGWQFYTPLMSATELQAYAASKGYAVLATINPGEGYWVNAKAQPTISAQSGDSFVLTGMNLMKGWNLVATGNDITPTELNTNLKSSALPANLSTLWAWDNPSSKWFFYAPSLEAQGGTALSGYITNKGYLDFGAAYKKLGNGTGFWVNR